MISSALNVLFLGMMINGSGGASLCFTANNLQGICVPLHDCRSALYEITQLRSPDFCYRHSAIPHVCCINNRGNQPLQAGPQQSNWNNPPQDYYYGDDQPPPPPPPLPLPQATYPPPPLPEIDLRIPPSSPAVPGSDSPESGQRQLPDADSITFHRLAERKCEEYSDYIFENRSIFDPQTSTTSFQRVNTCELNFKHTLVGGTRADPQEYPHMVLIGYRSDGDNDVQWLCGGAIISLKFVLTAAHCIQTAKGSPTQVRVGDLNHKSDSDDAAPQSIQVRNAIPHDQYRPPYLYNDIGLLELAHPIQITQFARPACLYTDHSVLPTVPLIATGWGRTDLHGPSSADLLEVTLEQFSTGDCGQTYKPSQQLPKGVDGDSQLCAGSRFEKKDTCKGDSGGPLQIKHEFADCMYLLVGVTSFGKGCGNIGVPGVYTRVSHYLDWIEEIAFTD